MITLTIEEIEKIKLNHQRKTISKFEEYIQSKNLKKERIRSKDPAVARMFASFNRS